MKGQLAGQRDIAAGLIYLAIGVAALWFGRGLDKGIASAMGPGYFPMLLGWLLIGLGGISVARGARVAGEPIGAFVWKPVLLVAVAASLFALLLKSAGLIAALAVTILVGATASAKFRIAPLPLLGMAALIAFCVVLFVMTLDMPMPLLGTMVE